MACYRIYAFSQRSGEREFVVISDLPQSEVVAEHGEGSELDTVCEIIGDLIGLPCDRRLRSEW